MTGHLQSQPYVVMFRDIAQLLAATELPREHFQSKHNQVIGKNVGEISTIVDIHPP